MQLAAEKRLRQLARITDDDHRQVLVQWIERRVPHDRNRIQVQRFPRPMAVKSSTARRQPQRVLPIASVHIWQAGDVHSVRLAVADGEGGWLFVTDLLPHLASDAGGIGVRVEVEEQNLVLWRCAVCEDAVGDVEGLNVVGWLVDVGVVDGGLNVLRNLLMDLSDAFGHFETVYAYKSCSKCKLG